MAWLQAGRTRRKRVACPARPALFWLNLVLFSSLEEFPGFELHLPGVQHSAPSYRGSCRPCSMPGRRLGKLSGTPTALYHGLGTVQTHQDSDLFWSGPLGLSVTPWGILSCFLSISRAKAHFAFPSPSSLGGFV